MSKRHRRSYGVDSDEQPEKLQTSPGVKTTPSISRNPTTAHSIATILFFPLKLIALIFTFLGWAWNKRPRLSKHAKASIKGNTLKLMLYGALFCGLAVIGLFIWASRDLNNVNPNGLLDRPVHQSTKIYDNTGKELLYEIFADEKRTVVTLDQIPKDLINGVIATEDTAFYDHVGIRPLSIIRSVVYGVIGKGRLGGGASTLTQQLVKNAILTNERTVSRKAKEIILSLRLEQLYTKDQILQIYFNEIPYGSTNYGVESAAQSYFGKSVSELSLPESATLAGLPKAPTWYLNDYDALKTRRNFVLSRMYAEGYITEEQKNTAQETPLEIQQKFQNIKAPHFVLYVKQLLVDEFGEQLVETGGLKVITSLDWNLQQKAEKVIEEKGTEVLTAAGANNTSLLSMDPKTGQILAMVGSKDFFDKDINGQFNVATLGKRQPGSSFKPIVYAAAFEKGFTPSTIVFDVLTNFALTGKPYQPQNYDLKEHGPVSLAQALQGSLNIAAVKVMYLVGEKYASAFAAKLGYSTLGDSDRFGLSLVLGGGEVKLIEHVRAYTIFANGGIKRDPVAILRVEDATGDTLKEWKTDKGERVIEESLAYTMSSILSDDAARAYAFGAGGVLTLKDRPVAVKTGTTNSYIDAWTVGYTPSLVTGVWAGNTDNTPMTRGFGGSRVAAPIWNAFMTAAHEGKPVETFPPRPENTAKKPALRGSTGGAITLKVNKITGNLASSSTPERLIVERTYTQPHSILHYVDKNNPRGDNPITPGIDPQYAVWEAAIQNWITRRKEADPTWEISFEEPPTIEDDAYSIGLLPTLTVVYPAPSSTIYSRQLDTDIRVSAPRGVKKVSYKLNGVYVGVENAHPFNLNTYAKDMTIGKNILTIIVEDDIGNRLEEEVPFTLDAEAEPPSVTWLGTFSSVSLPTILSLRLFKPEEIKEMTISASNGSETIQLETYTSFDTLFNNQLTLTISTLPVGSWTLTPIILTKNGKTIPSQSAEITVQ